MNPTTREAYKLFHHGTLALARMEHNGLRVDVDYLHRCQEEVTSTIKILENGLRDSEVYDAWRRRYGAKTNLGSRSQLGEVLFKVLRYTSSGVMTDSGRDKVDQTALEFVDVPFVRDYVAVEKWKKLKSTYLDGIQRELVGEYLHPSFNLNTTRTYRSSSEGINFQNIPVRDPERGKMIRQCFIARDGHRLVEIDYGGIEVRIAACYHHDPVMIKYIEDPSKDMHRDMAAECFLLNPKEVDKTVRYCSKNMFVFPQFYGDAWFHCAAHLWQAMDRMKLTVGNKPLKEHLREQGITELGACDPKVKPEKGTFEHHIQLVEKNFWGRRFPVYARWKQEWWNAYCKKGEFDTLTGFKCQGLYKRNEVINMPVQGSAFHCLLWSNIKIQRELDKRGMKTLLVGEIHDSLLADSPEEELEDFLTLANKVMTTTVRKAWPWIIVPLEIEVDVTPEGGSWHDKQPWVEEGGKWQLKGK